MEYITIFQRQFDDKHGKNMQKLKTYNTAENLEELNKIFEEIVDYVVVYISKMSTKEKNEIIMEYGETKAGLMLNQYYHKTLGYSCEEISKYFDKYNLSNKKVQLILQNAIGLDAYY